MTREANPRPKSGPKPKKRYRGRARPDEPLAERCQVAVSGMRCMNRATQRHHKLRRSQGGGDENANTLDVCDSCHDEIHKHPERSYDLGLLIRKSRGLFPSGEDGTW